MRLTNHVTVISLLRRREAMEEDPRILQTLTNEEDGLIIRVSRHVKGFSVTIQDVDSGEFLDTVKIFPTEEKARAFAESLA